MKRFLVMFLLMAFVCMVSANVFAQSAKEKPERKYVLERVKCGPKDFAVVQVYADNFDKLSLPDKLQIYYLAQAAIAGNDMWFDQNHREALKIKNLLEQIITHPQGIDKTVLKKIFNYTKIFWAEGGQYGERDKMKFVPEFTYDELLAAAKIALKNGANYDLSKFHGMFDKKTWGYVCSCDLTKIKVEKHLENYLSCLKKSIFDINYEPISACKDSKKDIIAESGINFYQKGVTIKDFDGFKENNQLNSFVEMKNGKLFENVYKIGGLYSNYLKKTNKYLEQAADTIKTKDDTGKNQVKTIKDLIAYFNSGDLKDFEKFNIQWVKTKGNVDFILGFIESYKDPRGVKASFEGTVFYTDLENTKLMNTVGANVKYFEEKMPWEDKYKRTNFDTIPAANSVIVALGSGDAGPQAPVGINLPNDEQIRQTYGTKSVSLYNILESIRNVSGDKVKNEFYLPEFIGLMKQYEDKAVDLQIALHEVCGHASGKTIVKDPDTMLREYARSWEETRAELVGLYNTFDPIFVEKGIFTKEELEKIGTANYLDYATGDFLNLRRIPGLEIQDDHMRAAHFVVTYLIEDGAVKPVEKDGKVYMTVPDFKKMHDSVGRLLSIVMDVKANGNYEKAKEMMTKYGIKVNTNWQKQVKERYAKLDLPMYRCLIYPQYELVKNSKGQVIDIKAVYNEGVTAQQLRFAGYPQKDIDKALNAEKYLK